MWLRLPAFGAAYRQVEFLVGKWGGCVETTFFFFFLAWEGLTHKVVGDAFRLRIAEAASLVWRVIWVGVHGDGESVRSIALGWYIYFIYIYILHVYC